MRTSRAPLSPLRARSTSCRSSSSRCAFCAAVAAGRAAIWPPPGSGARRKSHPKVEGEDSKVRFSLQAFCSGPRMLRTYVRVTSVGARSDCGGKQSRRRLGEQYADRLPELILQLLVHQCTKLVELRRRMTDG